MKRTFKTLMVILLLTFSVTLTACWGPKAPELTTTQVSEKILSLMDREELNLTLEVDGGYEITTTEGKDTKHIDGVVFKMDTVNDAYYFLIPGEHEHYSVGNYAVSKTNTGSLSIDYTNTTNNDVVKELVGSLSGFFSSQFTSIADKQYANVTSEMLESGDYQLNIVLDFKDVVKSLQQAIKDNQDKPLRNLIDAVLAVFDNQLTVDSIVVNLKENITQESTLSDMFDFLKLNFNFNLESILDFIEMDLSVLDVNFFELMEIESKEEFDAMVDDYVEMLSNEEFTLNNLLSNPEGTEDLGLEFINLFANEININQLVLELSITTNADVNDIKEINFMLNVDVDVLEENFAISADFKLSISDLQTTEIMLPEITADEVTDINIELRIKKEELVKDQPKQVQNIDLFGKDDSFVSFFNEVGNITYDEETKTLTLSKEFVNELLDNGYNSYHQYYNTDASVSIAIIFYE